MAQQDYTAIRVTEAVKEQAQEAKQDGETWDEYVLRCTEHPPEVREFVEADADTDLDSLSRSVATIEERTGKLERMLEGMGR